MEVFVNRKPVAVESGTSLAELLDRLGIAPDGTAAAVDNKVVPRDMWRHFSRCHSSNLVHLFDNAGSCGWCGPRHVPTVQSVLCCGSHTLLHGLVCMAWQERQRTLRTS